jgi:hypothetical protein
MVGLSKCRKKTKKVSKSNLDLEVSISSLPSQITFRHFRDGIGGPQALV